MRVLQLVLCASLTLSIVWARRDPKPGWNIFSREQDIQLGRESAAQVEQQMPVVRDSELQAYVERIGRKLASAPEAGNFPYSFKVVNDASINAFALPGGPTFVHTGLIRAAENEAQLAGVMAHEISHVALRHGTNQASKANLIQLPAALAGAVVGNGSLVGQLAQLGIGLGANSVLLKYSRNAESDADILGSRIMARAGYNPIEMARFFEKLQAESGSRGPQFLSSHPDPGNRMRAVQEEIGYLPRQDYSGADSNAFKRAQTMVGSLPTTSGQRGRAALGNGDPRPSSRMREYQGREFSIAYPDNWEAFGDSGAAAVTIAPRAGLAQDNTGNVQIAYGAMLSYYFPHRQGAGDQVEADTAALIGQLRQGNPTIDVSGQSRRTRIAGSEALVTTLISQSPLGGERETDMLVTIHRPEGLFYLVFIAPEREFRSAQQTFEAMLKSLRFR